MIAQNTMKVNGKWYHAGDEVKVEESPFDLSKHMNPPAQQSYSKTDINRMSTADLKAFARESGIDNAEDTTGAELKKVLIEKLGL